MKNRLAHWLSHGLKTLLTTSLSPPLLQRKEEHSAALNHPLSLRERARVRGILSSLRPLWLAPLLLPLIAMIGSAQASDLGALLGGGSDSFKKVLPGANHPTAGRSRRPPRLPLRVVVSHRQPQG